MFTKKRQLEMVLQDIPYHESPKINLEQYSTPSVIAADVLWNANSIGDIKGMKVVDLGCGTGIFAIGSALLGAEESVGVDIDIDAISIANSQAEKLGVKSKTNFVTSDIKDFHETADTVIQNPPFGAQKANRKGADRLFIIKALEIAPVVYSFHIGETEEFITNFFKKEGATISHAFHYTFPIPRTYDFHTKDKVNVKVVLLRAEI
ncbi:MULTISPECIES: METTL5 family protein [Methanobacterium]|uniref:METTL5 family protein n=1 Tax=Methanobacterium spitsbergense TaxID=2874285 RepID=A0A8T5UYF4_9EURY|nr:MULTISPECIES: METTL5 family protein [Methanobacterium]MBZ2166210.1 METTL5 family protein [Methanobacterium spitsbergense]